MIDKNKFKNIIAFCVLMENNNGILDKSPDYVLEKFKRYIENSEEDKYKWGLDNNNRLKVTNYINKWMENK